MRKNQTSKKKKGFLAGARFPIPDSRFLIPNSSSSSRGQSFIELALIIPILLIMLLGVVEVAFFIGHYLDLLDLTREAARFASLRDPFDTSIPSDLDCSTPDYFNFYYDTSCLFSPPGGSAACTTSAFCSGLNGGSPLDSALDDVVISVYTITDNAVTNNWPSPAGYWALSDHDSDTAHNANWTRDCQDNTVRSAPYFTTARVNASLESGAPPKRGYVAVEVFYCYHQALSAPLITQFIPDPVRTHAYTLMSLPAAQPTPTPIPVP